MPLCLLDPTEISGLWFRCVSVPWSRTRLGTRRCLLHVLMMKSWSGGSHFIDDVAEGFSLHAQLFLFIVQQKAEEIPKSDLGQGLKFFNKIWKGSSERFADDAAPEETRLRLWLSYYFGVFPHGANLRLDTTVFNKIIEPPPASSPLKPQLSSNLTVHMEKHERKHPRKKHHAKELYFNVCAMAFSIIGIIAIAL